MKRSAPFLLFLASAGCAPKQEAVEQCESLLKEGLKAPSSYTRVEVFQALRHGDTQSVFIDYDAVNSYNAPLRGKFWCVYDYKAKTASEGSVSPDIDPIEADAKAGSHIADKRAPSLDSAPSAAPAPSPSPSWAGEVPVCDREESESKHALMNELGVDCMGE